MCRLPTGSEIMPLLLASKSPRRKDLLGRLHIPFEVRVIPVRELGTDEVSMMWALRNRFIELPDGEDNLRVAYVAAIVPQGSPAPLEYCEERIREIILSARKHALTESLERDLLNDALAKGKFVIY